PSDPAGPVSVGDTITYTLTAAVDDAQQVAALLLSDPLGTGLTLGTVTANAPFTCNAANPLECTLPAGTVPGTYTVTYAAEVNDQATGTVNNAVVGSAGDCEVDCDIEIPVSDPTVTYNKTADTAGPVSVGDTITYTLTATVDDAQLVDALVLTDTLGTGLTLGTVTANAPFTCNAANPLECTLPAGTVPGTYTVTYAAEV